MKKRLLVLIAGLMLCTILSAPAWAVDQNVSVTVKDNTSLGLSNLFVYLTTDTPMDASTNLTYTHNSTKTKKIMVSSPSCTASTVMNSNYALKVEAVNPSGGTAAPAVILYTCDGTDAGICTTAAQDFVTGIAAVTGGTVGLKYSFEGTNGQDPKAMAFPVYHTVTYTMLGE